MELGYIVLAKWGHVLLKNICSFDQACNDPGNSQNYFPIFLKKKHIYIIFGQGLLFTLCNELEILLMQNLSMNKRKLHSVTSSKEVILLLIMFSFIKYIYKKKQLSRREEKP